MTDLRDKGSPSAPAVKFDFRRVFWTWHLYAGLFVGPVLIVISVTGAILVFPQVIERASRPDLWIVHPRPKPLADAALVETVSRGYPESSIFSYKQARERDESWVFWLRGEQRGFLEVFIDPYSGEILGDRWREKSLLRITEQLHRRLLTGKWGSVVVDLATGWTIVLFLTGIYLWWPKHLPGLARGLTVNLGENARKLNWRLHNTIGFYSFFVLLLLSLTGMVVSEVTGSMYRVTMFAAGAFPQSLISPPKSDHTSGGSPLSVDDAIDAARRIMGYDGALDVRFPQGQDGSFLVTTVADGARLSEFQAVIVDQYTGEVVEYMPWREAHPLMKVRSTSLAIHFGAIGGTPTRILAFVACLVPPVLCISGYLIWWWKRPSAVNRRSQDTRRITGKIRKQPSSMPAWLRAGILVFCLAFPSVGVSAIGVWGYRRLAFLLRPMIKPYRG